MSAIAPQKLCQIEIYCNDLSQSLAFYEGVFGWSSVPADIHGLVVLHVPDSCGFGICLVSAESLDPSNQKFGNCPITLYFEHDNPEVVLSKLHAFGGKRGIGPKNVPGYGNIYQLTDPNGVRFGLFCKHN